jgi:hypothetical protein
MTSTADQTTALHRYTADRPLVLWTDFPPDHGGGGAVVVRSLLSSEDRTKILWVSPSASASAPDGSVALLRSGSLHRSSRRSLFLDSTFLARSLAVETMQLASARGARALWVVLHGAGVPVAAEIARRTRLPIHVTVHDDPAFAVALRSRRYFALSPWIELKLAQALRGATSVDVIGEGMQERYRRRYGVRSIVVHRTVPGPVLSSNSYEAAMHGLRIGVLGNMYAYSQLQILGRAVAGAAAAIGVRARITVIGHGFAERLRSDLAGSDIEIEAVGHVHEEEAVSILRTCFALYLNYPFGARNAVLRETSFPTKLGTYVLAARPILIHAPDHTSLAPLSTYKGYVYQWKTMSECEGRSLLTRMWSEPSALASGHENAERLRVRYYDVGRNRGSILAALDALVAPLDEMATAICQGAR